MNIFFVVLFVAHDLGRRRQYGRENSGDAQTMPVAVVTVFCLIDVDMSRGTQGDQWHDVSRKDEQSSARSG